MKVAVEAVWMSRLARLIVVLAVGAAVTGPAGVEAASLQVSWTAPTTNANGTPLQDLGGYRIYLGTAQPACPGASFHAVPSPTATPAPGQQIAYRIAALSAGATYALRVTAVDQSGNESACSASVNGVAQPDFSVTPSTATSFGSVTPGGWADRTFTVQNTNTTSLTGMATAGAPFSIVSGGSFSLSPGASQAVTVRFQPTAAGTFAGNVNFTASGDTFSRVVSGTATATTGMTLSVTKSGTGAGTVTSSPAGIACGADCAETAAAGTQFTLTATAAAGSIFAGWSGACSGTGTCAVTLSTGRTVTATFNPSSPFQGAPVPVLTTLSPASADAGGVGRTLTVNGQGFVASSVVRWNGASRATTFVSATQLRATITTADLAVTPRSIPVSVFTPAPGGGTSGTLNFAIVTPPTSALPVAPSGLSVRLSVADATGVTFAVTWGAVSGAAGYRYIAAFNDGSASQQGTVTPPSVQLPMPYHTSGAAFGGYVCIRSLSATGQRSTNQTCATLSVPARPAASSAPVPVVTGLSPASADAGGVGRTLTVNGQGFVARSVVRWNGAARTTTFVGATQLRITLTAADLATPRSVPVSVFTSTPGGGTSGTVNFIVGASASATTSLPAPPPAPGNLTVTRLAADAGGVTFRIAWGAVSGATSYRYVAAFSDGSAAQQGSIAGLLSFQLRMPYHASGAAFGGYVCLRSVDAAGQRSTNQACSALAVPGP